MLKIRISLVSKQHQDWLTKGYDHYVKLLKPYVKLNWNVHSPAKSSLAKNQIKTEETNKLVKSLEKGTCKILCHPEGLAFDSQGFAQWILGLSLSHTKPLEFVIGGALGLNTSIDQWMDYKLSLSKMTLPHRLCLLVLLEQLYRASCILHNKTYHY